MNLDNQQRRRLLILPLTNVSYLSKTSVRGGGIFHEMSQDGQQEGAPQVRREAKE